MNHCSTGFIINCDCARQSELFQMKYKMKMAAVRPQFFKRLPCLIEASFFCSNLNRGNHKLQAIAKHMVMQHLSAFNRAIYWLQCSCHRASNAFSEVLCIYSFKYCVQCCIFTIAYKIVHTCTSGRRLKMCFCDAELAFKEIDIGPLLGDNKTSFPLWSHKRQF